MFRPFSFKKNYIAGIKWFFALGSMVRCIFDFWNLKKLRSFSKILASLALKMGHNRLPEGKQAIERHPPINCGSHALMFVALNAWAYFIGVTSYSTLTTLSVHVRITGNLDYSLVGANVYRKFTSVNIHPMLRWRLDMIGFFFPPFFFSKVLTDKITFAPWD